MSNNTNLSKLANVLDDGSSGQFLKSTGSGGVVFDTINTLTVYSTLSNLPSSGLIAGALAYVTATNRLYVSNGSRWYSIGLLGVAQQAKLTASDAAASDRFGEDVGASGSTVIVGAIGANAAYIFTKTNTTWSQQALLTASDAATGDQFGYGADVDGDTAVVTAPKAHLGSASDAGAAYVFVRSGTTWTQQQKIQASDAASNDYFGNEQAVAISGNYIVVGVSEDDNSAGSRAGAAYVYARSGTTWSQQAKLTASDAQATDLFGSAVGISGSTIVVGAIGEDTTAAQAGAVYVFTRSGTTWTQQQKIQASDAEGSDNFGESVDIDGDTLAVGAWNEDTGASNAGAAYIFTRSGSTWSQQAKLTANDAEADDMFGNAVSVNGDTVAVGAYHEDTTASGAGSVYVFTRSGTTWTQSDKLQASDAAADDYFGISVALDGGTVVAGAPLEDAQGNSAGSAYIFT